MRKLNYDLLPDIAVEGIARKLHHVACFKGCTLNAYGEWRRWAIRIANGEIEFDEAVGYITGTRQKAV